MRLFAKRDEGVESKVKSKIPKVMSSSSLTFSDDADDLPVNSRGASTSPDDKREMSRKRFPFNGKQIVGAVMAFLLLALLWDSTMTPPEKRFIKPDASDKFLLWVQNNPYMGLGAFLVVIAICVVLMIPVGTPLTLGCGYVYKGAYGWFLGVPVATSVAMLGSALGAVGCFLLGRYLMRERVRKWSRNYPLFDAIDIAVSEKGFRIMAMLYLTPILPLGPVSYMCGTTSMKLSSFAFAKVASTPLMLFYVFIGASTGTLISDAHQDGAAVAEAEQLKHSKSMILFGIVLSSVTIGCISHFIKKELYKIFEKQKQDGKEGSSSDNNIPVRKGTEETVELGLPNAGITRHRRHTATGPFETH